MVLAPSDVVTLSDIPSGMMGFLSSFSPIITAILSSMNDTEVVLCPLLSQWHLFCVLQSFFPPVAFRSFHSFFTCATLLRAFHFLNKPLVKVPDKTFCFTGPSFNSSSTSLSVKFVLCLSYLLCQEQVELYLACHSFKTILLFFLPYLAIWECIYKKMYEQMYKISTWMYRTWMKTLNPTFLIMQLNNLVY